MASWCRVIFGDEDDDMPNQAPAPAPPRSWPTRASHYRAASIIEGGAANPAVQAAAEPKHRNTSQVERG